LFGRLPGNMEKSQKKIKGHNILNSNASVSVYMPTHNRSKLLIRAINSVFSQTYSITELIVVDDGSQDDTWSILQSMAADNPKLVVIKHQEPKGACAARNSAIKIAKGEFITGVDDDDEILPNHIANLVDHWDERYSCIAASILNDNGTIRKRQGREYGWISLEKLLHYNRLGNQVLTKTDRLQSINGFDEALPAFQDYDCWVRLIDAFGPAYKLKEATYVLHTEHELDRISSGSERRLKALELFLKKHENKFSGVHHRSAELTKKRILGQTLGFTEAIGFLCVDNYRAVVSAYLTSLRNSK
jgi:glycosyltransferase involved in cell wall biosynthesis